MKFLTRKNRAKAGIIVLLAALVLGSQNCSKAKFESSLNSSDALSKGQTAQNAVGEIVYLNPVKNSASPVLGSSSSPISDPNAGRMPAVQPPLSPSAPVGSSGGGGNQGQVVGACGSNDGGNFTAEGLMLNGSSHFCSAGTRSRQVTGIGPFYWTCDGDLGTTPAACSAQLANKVVNGTCGSFDRQDVNRAPISDSELCASGSSKFGITSDGKRYMGQDQFAPNNLGQMSWMCFGQNGGFNQLCAANIKGSSQNPPVPQGHNLCFKYKSSQTSEDGNCGPANGLVLTKPPASCSTSLWNSKDGSYFDVNDRSTGCASGDMINLTMNNPNSSYRVWACQGFGGGRTTLCNSR
ncbi:MAG: hypothetical protein WA160_14815 [Pseudobdellovibrio sp.]